MMTRHFITPLNKQLFWAFGLVLGFWLIGLLISGVIWLTSGNFPATYSKKNALTKNDTPIQLKKFATDTAFRNYFTQTPKSFLLPAELPPSASKSAQISFEKNFSSKEGQFRMTQNTLLREDLASSKQISPTWVHTTLQNSAFISAQIYQDSMFVVIQSDLYDIPSCPIEIFKGEMVDCTSVWYSENQTIGDSVYTLLKINIENGLIDQHISYIGSSERASLYIKDGVAFATFSHDIDPTQLKISFYLDAHNNFVDQSTRASLQTINQLHLSQQALASEVNHILAKYEGTMNASSRLEWAARRDKEYSQYLSQKKRADQKTEIVALSLVNFEMMAMAEIPGLPVDEQSLDVYQGKLRIYTTNGTISVLNSDLRLIDSVLIRPERELVNSVQFIGDWAFLLSQNSTEELTVLNLKTHQSQILPYSAFSTFLYSLKEGLVLVVTQEKTHTRVYLYDIKAVEMQMLSSIEIPVYWSQIVSNKTAFTHNELKEEFTLPTNVGHYLFEYAGNKLIFKRIVSQNELGTL